MGLFCMFSFVAYTQPSRSGAPAPAEYKTERRFACEGSALLDQTFESGSLPAGWTAIDRDAGAPHPNIAGIFQGGWQSVTDFKDNSNRAIASPSWYADSSVKSDDWLISPPFAPGANTCFSWYAYSQDVYYPESYEVRIAFHPEPDSFLLPGRLLISVAREAYLLNYRSLNLSAYAGRQVYVAFRHTSKDRFALVLDDIRVAEVALEDAGAFLPQSFKIEPGDSVRIRASLRNYGLDTLRRKPLALPTYYNVNGGTPVPFILRRDSISLLPNDTIQFVNPAWFKPQVAAPYYICVWTEWPGDQNPRNDTACIRVGVGIDITGLEPGAESWQLYPNPAQGHVTLGWQGAGAASVQLWAADGRPCLLLSELAPGQLHRINLGGLAPGVYLIQLRSGRQQYSRRLVVLQ